MSGMRVDLTGLETEVEDAERKVKYLDFGTRTLTGRLRVVVDATALVFGLGELAYLLGLVQLDSLVVRPLHLAFAFALCFALYPFRQRSRGQGIPLWDWILIAVALGLMAYVMTASERLMIVGPGGATSTEIALGIVATLMVLEAGRRVVGPAMSILVLVLLAYALFGDRMPGIWGHRPFTVDFLSSAVYFSDRGIFGTITGLSAGVVAGFLIFGAILNRTGGGEAFVDLARLVAGRTRGGPAMVSSVSSALFGTVSGSAVANVIVDGVFNIPLMKRSGYKPEFAAAVESSTSTGGQIVPPVMGVAAFVMAQFLGRPYGEIALAAVIPAILYYAGLIGSIHFEAMRNGRPTVPRELIPSGRVVLGKVGSLIVPVATLIGLMTAAYTPEFAVAVSALVAIAAYLVMARTWTELRRRLGECVRGIVDGAKGIVTIAVLIACAEVVILVVDSTGLGIKLSTMITSLAETSLALALVAGMVTTLVLGMGVPTTAAYVIGAAVVVPSLRQLDVDPMAAHMFVLYFAVIAAITPPIAPAVWTASAIAGGSWWKAGVIATRLAFSAFLVPFLFVYSPALVLQGDPGEIVWRFALGLAGILMISAGVWGYLRRAANRFERVILVGAGVLLVVPTWEADLLGIGLGAAILLYEFVVPAGLLSRLARDRSRHGAS